MSLQSFAEGSPGLRRDLLKVILLCCTVEKVFSSTVLWPLGQYGLPMPKSNCPTAHGFVWKRGNIYQDLEDNSNQTRISPQSHLQAIILQSTNVMRNFCIKTDMSTSLDTTRKKWPKGQYCIYQKGSSCPAGMSNGSLLWDDENGVDGNRNSWNGTLPKGVYNHDTKIFFCCQRSGSYNVPIELPTDKPFYLLAFRPHCQEVLNTGHIMEFIEYATEIHNNHDKKSFPYPYGADFRNPRIHYCYYYYKVDKLTTSSLFTTAETNATRTTIMPSPTIAETTTTKTGTSTNTTRMVTTIVKTTSTTRPDGTSSSTVFEAESTPFTRTPSPTTAVEISTTDSTDHPGITRKADPTIENLARSARNQEDKTEANVAYVIAGVFSLLVVIAGVIALVHCHRKRRRNNNQSEDPGRLSVIYSTVDMKQESIGNNNLLNIGDIIIGKKINLNRDFQGGGPNTYEEIKDTKNPLYNLSTCLSFNIYEELVDVSNGENTGRTQNKNRRRKNNPAYERTEIRNPRRKENPAYESVDGVFKLKRDITSANSL